MTRTSYREQGRMFLAQAFEELARDDLRQASEKGWGAASQMVKALAQSRGWRHERHDLLHSVAQRLSVKERDRAYRRLFRVAGDMHTNFYEGHMDRDEVTSNLQHVVRLVSKLEELLARG